ncbi:hypothetical protein [Thioclava sp. GXIMD4216]|uniref:hypothetical protein n=1 Tax=Thioclava sp. GXIMD4216 TaxID=3131929 RepID=UPI0030D5A110
MPYLSGVLRCVAYAGAVAVSTWAIIDVVGHAEAQPTGVFLPLGDARAALEAGPTTFRPVIVLADTPDDPAYQVQMANLRSASKDLSARDIVVLSDTAASDSGDGGANGGLDRTGGFRIIVMGRNGAIRLNQTSPLGADQLIASFDGQSA